MERNLFIVLLLCIIITGCRATEPEPIDENPPGYQEDIYWPSLADSPWPMNRGNPMGTGKLKGYIPIFSSISQTYDKYTPASGAVAGEDSTIYFISYEPNSGLVCLDTKGNERWFFELPITYYTDRMSTPLVTKDGDIVFGHSTSEALYSISSNGELNWRIPIKTRYNINIGKDGTIYCYSADPKSINAISDDGEILWRIIDDQIYSAWDIIISPDGKTLYTSGVYGIVLLAYDIETQSLKWQIEGYLSQASPFVDSQGNIYIIYTQSSDDSLAFHSYNSDAELRWRYFPNEGTTSAFSPVIDTKGNLFIGFKELTCVSYEGNLKWKKNYNVISSNLLIDLSDNILFTNHIGSSFITSLVQLNTEGDNINQIEIPYTQGYQNYSPAVNRGSILLPLTFSTKVYLIQ